MLLNSTSSDGSLFKAGTFLLVGSLGLGFNWLLGCYTKKSLDLEYNKSLTIKEEVLKIFKNVQEDSTSVMELAIDEKICLVKTAEMLDLLPPIQKQLFIFKFHNEVISKGITKINIVNYAEVLHSKIIELNLIRTPEVASKPLVIMNRGQMEMAAHIESVIQNSYLLYSLGFSCICLTG